jgi:phage recombination protein Bet
MTQETALAPVTMTPDQVQLIKNTVAKGATNDELQLFLHLSQSYGLDPFAKEIWCIKYGNSAATIFTSRDGYLKIANGHPAFDGIVSDVVRQGDRFQVKPGSVEHSYGDKRGQIEGAYALVFRKDRQYPVYVFAPFAEYNAPSNGTWKKYPSAMILKVAEAMALKRAFSISGLVTREELDASDEPRTAPVANANARALPAPAPDPERAVEVKANAMTVEQEAEIREWLDSGEIPEPLANKTEAWLDSGDCSAKAAAAVIKKLRAEAAVRIEGDPYQGDGSPELFNTTAKTHRDE